MGISEDETFREIHLSCTFCGPGTWSVWEVVTDDGVFFVCIRHHVEMGEANVIKFERRMGQISWKEFKFKNLYE